MKEKLDEATYQQQWNLLVVLREANREINTKLNFLKWMEEMVFFIEDWGYPKRYNDKLQYSELLEKYEKLQVWRERLDNVPEVWSTENRLFQVNTST